MSKIYIFFNLFLVVALSCGVSAAQKKDRVEVAVKVSAETASKDCKNLLTGRAKNLPKPDYPTEAKTGRLGGTVLVQVGINEKGVVSEITSISGQQILQSAATVSAKKVKFTSTTCDGTATASSAVLTFNFLPYIAADKYFTPTKIGEFTDLKKDSPYYEAVTKLTENYRFAFGYADQKFYADAPLTRGDFAHFLRLTLDLLSAQAAANNKLPREINLFNSQNPSKLLVTGGIKDLKPTAPFYESVKTLLLKYDIALINAQSELRGDRFLTNKEVIDLWSDIFGAEAIPVNFGRTDNADLIISRGEFALFLEESLQVLTYKVLP